MIEPIRAQGISIHARSVTTPRITRHQAAAMATVLRLITIGVFLGEYVGFDYRELPAEVLSTVLGEGASDAVRGCPGRAQQRATGARGDAALRDRLQRSRLPVCRAALCVMIR